MRKLFDRVLSFYAQSDLDLQLKARFFLGVCLFNMAMVVIITVVTLYIQATGFKINGHIISALICCFFLVQASLVLLVRGQFSLAAHMIIIINLMTIWTVVFFDPSHPVSRLDSTGYILCVLSVLPLAVNRLKRVFFVYGAVNIVLLFGFILLYRSQFPIPDYAVIDFLSDNTIMILITCSIAFSVFTINRTALDRAKAEIEERKLAEATVQCQKEKLESVNSELQSTLEKMAGTTIELEKTNTRLKKAQTELVSTNELLRESEEKFSKAFHLSPIMIGIVSLDQGRFVDISNSFSTLLEYTPEDIIGHTSLDLNLWARDSDFQAVTTTIRSGGKLLDMEIILRSRLGKLLNVLVSSERVSIAHKIHIIMVGIDITEYRRAEHEKTQLENQLRQAQKMEAVGHLAGGIAHDFNNMLSVVIGNTELVMMDEQISHTIFQRHKTIHDAALRSADLVRQLLAFARKQTISPRVLDINETIAGMLNMLKKLIGENIHLDWIPCDDRGTILIDPSQVDQILANLMVNARDAIQGVGSITIETRHQILDEAYCKGHPGFRPGVFVILAVSDDGCGMDDPTMRKIFEPFYTTKAVGRGTGLGLATVYGIVKQNDGFINVYSEPGRGTTFRIYLPLIDGEKLEPDRQIEVSALHKGSSTVLMVEDDPAILDIGKSILEQLGYKVLTADSPDKAIQIVLSYKGPVDLLLTDVVMPNMNGRELAMHLSQIKPGLRCLYMSGYTANVIAHHGVLDEGVLFLPKPFSVRDLADKVREAMTSPLCPET